MSNKELLLASITRRPFRRSALSIDTYNDILDKITQAERAKMPLQFSVPFGAYKHHNAPMYPHINWAEVFWLDYLRQYAEEIEKQVYWQNNIDYAPTVIISFTYTSGVLTFINGGDAEERAQIYRQEFAALCEQMTTTRIKFELIDIADRMGGSIAALAKVEQAYLTLKSKHHSTPINLSQYNSANRNLQTEIKTEEQIRDAALRCIAMESMQERRALNKYGLHIQLTHIKGSLAVHIGSCRTSIVQPWVGIGVLENNMPRIISANSFQTEQWQHTNSHSITETIRPKGSWPGLTQIFVSPPIA